jgi:hypothetical protein
MLEGRCLCCLFFYVVKKRVTQEQKKIHPKFDQQHHKQYCPVVILRTL